MIRRAPPSCESISHCARGALHFDRAELGAAETAFRTALKLAPDLAEARRGLAQIHLLRGHWPEGWRELGRLWQSGGPEDRGFTQPLWQGEALAARRLLIHGATDPADFLLFARFLPLVGELGGSLLLETGQTVAPFAALLDSRMTVPMIPVLRGDVLPEFDLHCPLAALPAIFDCRIDHLPMLAAPTPCAVPPRRICFAARSVPKTAIEDAAMAIGATLCPLPENADVVPCADVFAACDLVICDGDVRAHLAGFLGRRSWVAHRGSPDWRWMLEGDRTPWHPTLRLFRQDDADIAMAAQLRAEMGS